MAKTEHNCSKAGKCDRVDKPGSPCKSQDKVPGFGAIHKPDHDKGCHAGCWPDAGPAPTSHRKRR